MFDTLKNLFRAEDTSRSEVPRDVAIAALLVEAARADGVYDADERGAVLRLLREMLDLSVAEAEALHGLGDAAQSTAPDVVRFTRVIKMGLTEDERIGFMQALWHVVLIDHNRDPHENALLRHLAPLIAISDRDSVSARQRALAQIDTEDS